MKQMSGIRSNNKHFRKVVLRNNKWWYRYIRGMNWFSFRYWWFNWLTFFGCVVLFWWFCPCTDPTDDISCDNSSINQYLNDISTVMDSCCDCRVASNNQVFEADYLIVTYQFDRNGGKDLDTKTQITSPINSLPVGFCNRKTRNISQSSIIWSGDNTGYGVESCLIDLTQFSPEALVRVLCKATWYGTRLSGNMSIDIRAYLGGVMNLSNFQFFNSGGQLTAELSFNENVNSPKQCPIDEVIGTISYDKSSMKLDFY